jgi:hypothetical protein
MELEEREGERVIERESGAERAKGGRERDRKREYLCTGMHLHTQRHKQ